MWALISEVRPLLCYRQEHASELLFPRPGLCSHSFSKACTLLTMLVCILPASSKRVRMLRLSIGLRTEPLGDGISLLLCLCINSGACVCNGAGLHLPVGCVPASLSCFIVLEI